MTTDEKTMIEAPEIRELLKGDFEGTAYWRHQKAEEYPADRRNVDAERELTALAATVDQIPDDVLVAYAELLEDHVEMHSEMLRGIGFHMTYSTALEYVRDFISSRTS
ncbi:MAG: hypothetical protein WBE90_22280 [Xanthobacteraceae bacterium]